MIWDALAGTQSAPSQSLAQDSLILGPVQGFGPLDMSLKNCEGILVIELLPKSPPDFSLSKEDVKKREGQSIWKKKFTGKTHDV